MWEFSIQLPISYKDTNYKAIVNTTSQKSNYLLAKPFKNNEIQINDLGGITTEFTVIAVTIGLVG